VLSDSIGIEYGNSSHHRDILPARATRHQRAGDRGAQAQSMARSDTGDLGLLMQQRNAVECRWSPTLGHHLEARSPGA